MNYCPTFAELREYVKRPGIKVYAIASISTDDEIMVEVKKGDFLKSIQGWTGKTNAVQDSDGNVIFG